MKSFVFMNGLLVIEIVYIYELVISYWNSFLFMNGLLVIEIVYIYEWVISFWNSLYLWMGYKLFEEFIFINGL